MKINQLAKSLLGLLAMASILSITACNGGSGASTSNPEKLNNAAVKTVTPRLFFDTMSQIPVSGNNKFFMIRLHNYSNDSLILQNDIRVIDPDTHEEIKDTLEVSNSVLCKTLDPNQKCSLTIKPHFYKKTSAIIQASYKNSNSGKVITASQMIRLNPLSNQSAGLAFNNDVAELTSPDGYVRMALPVVLDKTYKEIKVQNGEFICSGIGYKEGHSCTYFVDVDLNGKDTSLITTEISAIDLNNANLKINYETLVEIKDGAYLLVTRPDTLVIGDKEKSATAILNIFNAGTSNAVEVSINPLKDSKSISIENNQCGSTLAPSTSCNTKVQVTSDKGGAQAIAIGYKSSVEAKTKTIPINIRYKKAAADDMGDLNINSTRSLANTLVNETKEMDITLENKGNINLSGIRYALDNSNSAINVISGTGEDSCAENGKISLAKGESCKLKLRYAPTIEQTGDYTLNISGNYLSQGAIQVVAATHVVGYSAVNGSSIINFDGADEISINAWVGDNIINTRVRLILLGQ